MENNNQQHSITSLEASSTNVWDLGPNKNNFRIKMFKIQIKDSRLADSFWIFFYTIFPKSGVKKLRHECTSKVWIYMFTILI